MRVEIDLPEGGFNTIVNTSYGPMVINKNDTGGGGEVRDNGISDTASIETLSNLYGAMSAWHGHGSLLDIGANIGHYSLSMAKKHPLSTVHSFEAQRFVFNCLAASVALSSLENIYLHHKAVGNRNGSCFIPSMNQHQKGRFGSLSIVPIGYNDTGCEIDYSRASEKVEMVRIDDLDLGRINVMKIDVEGMELDVLEGAENQISIHRPFLYAEFIKTDTLKLYQWLMAHDYDAYSFGIDVLCFSRHDPLSEKLKPALQLPKWDEKTHLPSSFLPPHHNEPDPS